MAKGSSSTLTLTQTATSDMEDVFPTDIKATTLLRKNVNHLEGINGNLNHHANNGYKGKDSPRHFQTAYSRRLSNNASTIALALPLFSI